MALSCPAHLQVTHTVGQFLAKQVSMRIKSIVLVLLIAFIMVACTPAIKNIPTSTATVIPTQTYTAVAPTLTATWWMTPQITATPMNLATNTDDEVVGILQKIHPYECFGQNEIDPTSLSSLKFNEINELPDSSVYYVEEIADNVNNSRKAIVACMPDKCVDYVYVKDNVTSKAYQIDWGGRMDWRPIQRLIWIDQDVLLFDQSANPHFGYILVIDVAQKEFKYFGMSSDQCLQSTPTP
jgi:hypothetical protein